MKINHVVKTLVLSDLYINAGFSVFAPVFAVFVTKQVSDGSLAVVGFAAAIFQIFKSSLQIPIAKYLDKNHGEYDDFYSMVLGTSLIALVPFLYLFATKASHVYMIQALYGIGASFAIPTWILPLNSFVTADNGLAHDSDKVGNGQTLLSLSHEPALVCKGNLRIF